MVFKEVRQNLCIAVCCIVFQKRAFKNVNNIRTMCHKFLRFGLNILTKQHNLNELAQFLSNTASLTDKFVRNRMHYVVDGVSYDKDVSIFIKICHSHYRSPPLEPSSPLTAAKTLNSLEDTLSTEAARCTGSFTSTPSSLVSTGSSTSSSLGTNR